MSAILVVTQKGKIWVLDEINWRDDWNAQAKLRVDNPEARFTYSRAGALIRAHAMQRKTPTQFGVWEHTLPPTARTVQPRGGRSDKNGDTTHAAKQEPGGTGQTRRDAPTELPPLTFGRAEPEKPKPVAEPAAKLAKPAKPAKQIRVARSKADLVAPPPAPAPAAASEDCDETES